MKIIKKISFLLIFFLFINLNVFARYNLNKSLKAFSLNRDVSEIVYNIKKSEESYTKDNVTLEIETNKKVENVEGFDISEDGKKLTRVIAENESAEIILKDFYGISKKLNYEITNIDKIAPTIEGLENGKKYNSSLKPIYKDNVEIKDIIVERYGNLEVQCYTNYYDTKLYKGIDVNKNSISTKIICNPKNTVKYKYYLNNNLEAETNEKNYTFKELLSNTNYTIVIEAINGYGEVLETYSKTIKTKMFEEVSTEKTENNFSVFLSGIDSRVTNVICTEYKESDRNDIKYTSILVSSDGTLKANLNALSISEEILDENYYLQIHMKDGNDNTLDKLTFVVKFKEEFNNEYNINPYYLDKNGEYIITVTDLAKNETKINFIIEK